MEIKYKESDPGHYRHVVEFQEMVGSPLSYSIYDLRELIRKGLWNPQKE